MNRILKYLFYLILIIFPFGQLFRLDLAKFLPGLRLHLIDFSVFAFVIAWFLKKVVKKEGFNLPLFSREILIFGVIAAFSLFLQIGRLKFNEFLGASFYLLRFLNFIAFFFALVDVLKKDKLPIYDYLLGEGVVIAFFSIFQYLILPDTRFLFNLGWDKHYFRAIGSFLDPSFTGLLLDLSFIIWIINFVENKGRKNLLQWTAGFLLLATIGLTFSRIAYLSLIVGLSAIFLLDRKLRPYLFACLVFLGIVVILPKPGGEGVNLFRVSSFIARSENYKYSLAIIKDNFWTGVGFNAYRYVQRNYGFISSTDWQETNAGAGADNTFLFVLATTGILGLVTFLYFWLKVIYFSFVFSRKKKSSLLLFASIVSVMVSAFVVNSLFYAWIMIWLVILLASFTVDNSPSIPTLSYSRLDQGKRS